MKTFHSHSGIQRHRRQGSLMPAMAIAFLVVGGFMAWVLNQSWLSTAQEELRTAASSCALAAAQKLVGDELLVLEPDALKLSQAARDVVEELTNRFPGVGEHPQEILAPYLDVHLGRVVVDSSTGHRETLETDYFPTSVVVIAQRFRTHGNGVALLAPYLTGQSAADVSATAEASISNLVLGVRPIGRAAVPAWPLGVLEFSDDPQQQSWVVQIEQRQGADNLSWDESSQQVKEEPDGLPEIVLRPRNQEMNGNLLLLDIGNQLQDDLLQQQFDKGWTSEDLEEFGGEFSFSEGSIPLAGSNDFRGVPTQSLENAVGQVRLIVLFEAVPQKSSQGQQSQWQQSQGISQVIGTRLVSGRIMKVSQTDAGMEVILQPSVIATRMAILDEEAVERGETEGNPYLYKISLTQ